MENDNFFMWSLAGFTDSVLFCHMGNTRLESSYAVFSCPKNPFYRWGNRIHFGYAQNYSDSAFCEKIMVKEFGRVPDIQHYAFSWDVASYVDFPTQEWESLGYGVDYSDTLVLKQRPTVESIPNDYVYIQRLTSEEDWQEAQECQVLVRSKHWNERDFRNYLAPKFKAYRQIAQDRQGVWLGAFTKEGLQVGNLGVIYCKQKLNSSELIARFQMVATHPKHQQRGVCKQLLQAAIQEIFRFADLEQLRSVVAVIVADPDYHAKTIYQRIGFKEEQYQVIVTKQSNKLI